MRELAVLRIPLRPSRRLAAILCLGHLAALLVVAALIPLAAWAALGLPIVIANWLLSHRHHVGLKARASIVALELSGETHCLVRRAEGRWIEGRVLPSSYVLPWLIVLHIRCENRKRILRLLLFPDAMTAQMHRRVRVRLRWAAYDASERDPSDPPL